MKNKKPNKKKLKASDVEDVIFEIMPHINGIIYISNDSPLTVRVSVYSLREWLRDDLLIEEGMSKEELKTLLLFSYNVLLAVEGGQ